MGTDSPVYVCTFHVLAVPDRLPFNLKVAVSPCLSFIWFFFKSRACARQKKNQMAKKNILRNRVIEVGGRQS